MRNMRWLIKIGTKQGRYYDFGAKYVLSLICLPGIAGIADVYYKQIMSLSMKGYRVISVDIPRVWNHHEWIGAFENFLDAIDVHHVPTFERYPNRLIHYYRSAGNSGLSMETESFSKMSSFFGRFYGIQIRIGNPFGMRVETLSRQGLAARLNLTVDAVSVGHLLLSHSFISTMDTKDYSASPQQLKDQLSERYPGARRAYLKTGGDFPFLARPDEVNLHLQLHLRRVGLEIQPDLAHVVVSEGNTGMNEEKDENYEIGCRSRTSGKKDHNEPEKEDNKGDSEKRILKSSEVGE